MNKGLKRLILGVVLFLSGVFVVPFLVLAPLLFGDNDEMLFPVPGSETVQVAEPGRYYLWNHYQVMHEGRSYRTSDYVPNGTRIAITDTQGNAMELIGSSNMEFTRPASAKRSVGYVDIATVGAFQITVSGIEEKYIFSFSESPLSDLLSAVFGGIAASAILAAGGIALIIWGALCLGRSRREGS